MSTSCSPRHVALRAFAPLRCLALATLLLAFTPAIAQPAAGGLQSSSTIVVTATRTESRADEAIAEVTVIDRAQIERATGQTLVQLLASQPGLQFTQSGGPGSFQSIFIRGLEARHTLLLIDGIRYGSATVGTPVWENLPLDAIERIEIVRGPLSALYGTDAVAGAVQIFTRRGAQGVQTHGVASVGSNGYLQLGTGVRFGEGNFDGAVHVQHTQLKGFSATNSNEPFGGFNPDRDGFRQQGGSLQLGWKLPAGWRADARLLRATGTAQYDDGLGVDARAGLKTEVMSVQLGGPVSVNWRSVLRIGRSVDEYDTRTSASPFSDLGVIGNTQKQVSWENSIVTSMGVLTLLGEHLGQSVSRPQQPYTVSERTINAYAVGLNGRAQAHRWQVNLRHDSNSQFGSQNTGTVGYSYDLNAAWRAGASWGTSFVAPSFNQLYYPGFGNPNLLPEEGRHGELNLRWASAGQQLRMAYFDNRIRGYISSGPQPTNIPRTRIDGFTLAYEARLANWMLGLSGDFIDPRNDTAGSANEGKLLPRRAKQTLRATADVDLGAWRLGGTLKAFGSRYDDIANNTRIGGFTTLDLRAETRISKGWAAGVRVNNLAAKVYETVYGYNQPGREAFLTLRYSGG